MERPEKIKVVESLRSIREIGGIALDALKLVVAETVEKIDTRFANRINGADDES